MSARASAKREGGMLTHAEDAPSAVGVEHGVVGGVEREATPVADPGQHGLSCDGQDPERQVAGDPRRGIAVRRYGVPTAEEATGEFGAREPRAVGAHRREDLDRFLVGHLMQAVPE